MGSHTCAADSLGDTAQATRPCRRSSPGPSVDHGMEAPLLGVLREPRRTR